MEIIILCKIYTISGWGIETFYLIRKKNPVKDHTVYTVYLLGVDIIEIANSKLILKTYFYMI